MANNGEKNWIIERKWKIRRKKRSEKLPIDWMWTNTKKTEWTSVSRGANVGIAIDNRSLQINCMSFFVPAHCLPRDLIQCSKWNAIVVAVAVTSTAAGESMPLFSFVIPREFDIILSLDSIHFNFLLPTPNPIESMSIFRFRGECCFPHFFLGFVQLFAVNCIFCDSLGGWCWCPCLDDDQLH